MSLNELAADIHEYAVGKGWWPEGEERSMGDILTNIHSEVTEAWEDYRNNRMEVYYDDTGKPCGFPTELIDILVRVLDVCAKERIDVDSVWKIKMDFNRTRPYRHGNKRA